MGVCVPGSGRCMCAIEARFILVQSERYTFSHRWLTLSTPLLFNAHSKGYELRRRWSQGLQSEILTKSLFGSGSLASESSSVRPASSRLSVAFTSGCLSQRLLVCLSFHVWRPTSSFYRPRRRLAGGGFLKKESSSDGKIERSTMG